MSTTPKANSRRNFLRSSSAMVAASAASTILPSITVYAFDASNVKRDGASFVVTLSHDDVKQLNAAGTILSGVFPELAPIVGSLVGIVKLVDTIGGNHGVEISGALGSTNMMIVPQGKGFFGTIIKAVGEVVRFMTRLQLGVLVSELGIKLGGRLFSAPSGSIHADEKRVRGEETFVMVTTTDNKVAFLSHKGYFSASSDDHLVWANRNVIGRDEKFDLVDGGNGKVSLRSWMGTYLSADDKIGRNQRISANRKAPDINERFVIEFLGDGKVAIKAHDDNYLSVAP